MVLLVFCVHLLSCLFFLLGLAIIYIKAGVIHFCLLEFKLFKEKKERKNVYFLNTAGYIYDN
jgi:hypothetical protein